MDSKIYDLIILGAGPAGITAAVYAARKKLDFLVITKDVGGQAAWSGDIENYTGYQFISGADLTNKFQEHMSSLGTQLNMPEAAKEIKKEGDLIRITTERAEYLSKTLIVATGKRPRQLNIEGEKEYRNKGVTYCATCDGPVFTGKTTAIIGGGNSALDAALQMMKISPKVYIVNNSFGLTGDAVMIEKVKESAVVEIWDNSQTKRIYGDKFVKGIEIEREGKTHSLGVEGVFIEIGLIPNSGFAAILDKNKTGEIIVDCAARTNYEGIFAAGDVTNVPEKQIVIACGEGSKACLTAFRYLAGKRIKV